MKSNTREQDGTRNSRGWFKPGVSGNPGGRPREVSDIRALAQERTQDALDALTEIVSNKKAPPAARVAAANSLLDRGYGRPLQQSEVTNITAGARKASDMTDDELVALLDQYKAQEALQAKTNGEEPKPRSTRSPIPGCPVSVSNCTTRN